MKYYYYESETKEFVSLFVIPEKSESGLELIIKDPTIGSSIRINEQARNEVNIYRSQNGLTCKCFEIPQGKFIAEYRKFIAKFVQPYIMPKQGNLFNQN